MWAGRYVCGSSVAGCGGKNESHYGHGLVAVSDDGVHFEDHSAFNAEVGNVVWDKCMVHKLKEPDADGRPVFVMDHGTSGAVSGAHPRLLSRVYVAALETHPWCHTQSSPAAEEFFLATRHWRSHCPCRQGPTTRTPRCPTTAGAPRARRSACASPG